MSVAVSEGTTAYADQTAPKPSAPGEQPDPRTTSGDYDSSICYWAMVNAILCGVDALRGTGAYINGIPGPHIPYENLAQLFRSSGSRGKSGRTKYQSPFLPQYPNEKDADYDIRRCHAPLTNIYKDISANLSGKPFSKMLTVDDGTPEDVKKLCEDIDGQGNNLHVFASVVFKSGIDKGIDWILVDYPVVPAGASLDQERKMNARPYWVHVPCEKLLAVYSDFVKGSEVLTHARIYEPVCRKDGYGETMVERVRVLDRQPVLDALGTVVDYAPATWEVYELRDTVDEKNQKTKTWVSVSSGAYTIGVIPLVPYVTGKRDGTSWRVEAPLENIAHMQIEEFQQESGLKHVKTLTAFPMLAGQGIARPKADTQGRNDSNESATITAGPSAVLFAPPNADGEAVGKWEWLEPTAQSLVFLAGDLEKLQNNMRDLGMQPLTTANLTVITTANVAMKAHSAVQKWAIALKDALEQAMKVTMLWMKKDQQIIVKVHTDFAVELQAGEELNTLNTARAAKDLSQKTYWSELGRRGILSDDFDPAKEEAAIAEETVNLVPEENIDPRTGQPLPPAAPPQPPRVVPIKAA